MALNTKILVTRSLSALVFVLMLLSCVYWSYLSFTLFFFISAVIGLKEFYSMTEKMGAKPYKLTGFILGSLIYLSISLDEFLPKANLYFSPLLLLPIIIFCSPFIIFARGLFSKNEKSMQNVIYTIAGIIYTVLPFALLNDTVFCLHSYDGSYFEPKLILGIIFLIWSNDTFAYLGGSLFGKHKMIERVSPGKTWEGTITGVLITFGLSFSFNNLILQLTSNHVWPILGIVIPVLATVGDLIESKLKREAGIKDSGKIMPGHGGILDRFDSLLFVSPFAYVFFSYIYPHFF